MIFQPALDALASVLFAAPCRICDAPLLNASRIPICRTCLASFAELHGLLCPCCGRPQTSASIQQSGIAQSPPTTETAPISTPPLCRLCRAKTFAFVRARNWAAYNESLTAAIMLLKYEEVTRLGDWFAARLVELHARLSQADGAAWRADAVVPVPLHADRRRERGYNQVDMIARPLAKRLKLPFRPYLLARTKPRPARLVLSRSEHWESVRGAYAIREGSRVDKLRILLVDDVMTTGATLDACSRALLAAGATEVVAITVARAIPHQG
ncbi:MAG: ComF family protein [Candidatus Acidiferrales bacterium]